MTKEDTKKEFIKTSENSLGREVTCNEDGEVLRTATLDSYTFDVEFKDGKVEQRRKYVVELGARKFMKGVGEVTKKSTVHLDPKEFKMIGEAYIALLNQETKKA